MQLTVIRAYQRVQGKTSVPLNHLQGLQRALKERHRHLQQQVRRTSQVSRGTSLSIYLRLRHKRDKAIVEGQVQGVQEGTWVLHLGRLLVQVPVRGLVRDRGILATLSTYGITLSFSNCDKWFNNNLKCWSPSCSRLQPVTLRLPNKLRKTPRHSCKC